MVFYFRAACCFLVGFIWGVGVYFFYFWGGGVLGFFFTFTLKRARLRWEPPRPAAGRSVGRSVWNPRVPNAARSEVNK